MMRDESDKTDQTTNLVQWLGYADLQTIRKARTFGALVGILLLLLFLGALAAAVSVLFHTISQSFNPGSAGPNLGAGALIAALLGAPFVIWGTVLKYQTVSFQKEGHITDRINKAVEQLGAEKKVDRIGRPITLLQATGFEMLFPDANADKTTRRVIEWQGHPVQVQDGETISETGDWQVFSETVPNIEVRIGAILSLERIAQDSTRYDKGRDHVRVMEILCAYIRENAPASEAKDHDLGEWEPLPDDAPPEAREGRRAALNERREKLRKWIDTLPEPRADIALALQVIGRRDAAQRRVEARWGQDADPKAEWVFDIPCPELPEVEGDAPFPHDALKRFRDELREWRAKILAYPGYRLDLRKTNLQRADLIGLCLSGANLNRARMHGAHLDEARMEGASLDHALMDGARGYHARMEGATLNNARVENGNLHRVNLQAASLMETYMETAILMGARMSGANLSSTRLEGALLYQARMEWAIIHQARMDWTQMHRVKLYRTWVDHLTSFSEASLSGAFSKDVNLYNANLTQSQIDSMFGDGSVTLPEGLTRPAHWPKRVLEWDELHTEHGKWRASPATYTPPE